MPNPLISACDNLVGKKVCGSSRVMVRYTEAAYAYFNDRGGDREDGHDVEGCELDFSSVYCRDCEKKRTITEVDGQILEGTYEPEDPRTEKDEEGQ